MKQKNYLFIALFASFLIFDINSTNILRTNRAIDLRLDMRKLWEDHIVWTRNVIISAIANLADLGPVTQRLLQNQEDIANATKPYFGRKFAEKLRKLLREHILIAADIIADAIAGNIQQFNLDYEEWRRNARDIAEFLSDNNPEWSRRKIKRMLYEHLDLTAKEVSSRLQANWEGDIQAYDENHIHMLEFADILSRGIVKNFRKKF